MEHLDKLIPLAILGMVGVFLVFMVRRAMRETVRLAPLETASPLQSETDAAIKTPAPSVVANPVVQAPRKKRKRIAVLAAPPTSEQTPITTVVDLLRKKDTLAAAFILREILAPPVSKRQTISEH